MPRGKGTVYTGTCKDCNATTTHVRVLKSKKADFRKLEKFCGSCRKRTEVKLKEEKHSS